MIHTLRGYIYSPLHPSEYLDHEGDGPGAWVANDIPKWNLVYLSFPELDDFHIDYDRSALIKKLDLNLMGKVMSLAREDLEYIYPGLRDALMDHPRKLIPFLQDPMLLSSPPGRHGGKSWVDTMIRRCFNLCGEKSEAAKKVEQSEEEAKSTVIKVDFSKRRT